MRVMFSDLLKKAMRVRGVTSAELARRVNASHATIDGYMDGVREPTISRMMTIADALEVSPVALLSNKAYKDHLKSEKLADGIECEIRKLMDGIEHKGIVNAVMREEKIKIINDLRDILERAEA